ncbi:MAG: hypothetical protein NC357_09105, partial [Bacteroides sp.]|nr:hypothetical protein [Bacteroides sp.]
MKRIFGSLLAIALAFSFVGRIFGDNVTMPAGSKVRYAIELKKLSKQEADDAVAAGYVDLWVWAYVNQKFMDAGYITLRNNEIYDFTIRFVSNTQGYQIVYKDGTNDLRADNKAANPDWVASFAGKAQQEAIVYERDERSQIGTMQILDCNGSGSGGSLDGPLNEFTGPEYMVKVETFEGETWYGRALYKLRFSYNKAESFYVEHRFNNQPANNCGYATSNFNIRVGTSGNVFAPYPNGCNGNADWSQTHADNPAGVSCEKIQGAFGTIRGGVEIESDPEMKLVADKLCGGEDLSGKLDVKSWNQKTWADYSKVTVYVVDASGAKHNVTAQVAFASGQQIFDASGNVTATSNTNNALSSYAFTLPASAYMINGAPAKSLMWD